ncbi:MAG: ISKra4 family transposase [Myxococcota bacterium]
MPSRCDGCRRRHRWTPHRGCASPASRRDRLTPGQKPNRKRMAAVATLYDLEATPRGSEDVLRELGHTGPYKVPKKPKNKRVWASLEHGMKEVVADGFLAALDRDENLERRWVVLVDGNEDQMAAVRAQATAIGIHLTVVLDVIHVLEYLWKAGQAVLGAQDAAAVEAWVTARAKRILDGESSDVAAGIRRSATARNLRGDRRKAVDSCCGYLLNHREQLRYHEFLRDGLPIATGVIEGACRSLVRDRMDLTGARWGLPGAEAVLKLRSLRASGDFDEYWRFHQRRELKRNHLRSYAEDELAELREAA